MRSETRNLINNYLDDELRDLLDEDVKEYEARLNKYTDDDWLRVAEHKYKSPLIPLYRKMEKAEKNPTDYAKLDAIGEAIKADEFFGAYLRMEMHKSKSATSLDFFEFHYLLKMAEYQEEKDKSRDHTYIALNPSTLKNEAPHVYHELLNPAYREISTMYQVELMQATQEAFDDAEDKVLKPLGKKAQSRGGFGAILALLVWAVGGLFLWDTFFKVWNWAFDFISDVFFPLILFFWVIPIVYGGIVIGTFFSVGTLISDIPAKRTEKKLKAKIAELKADAAHSVHNTATAEIMQKFDQDIPSAFHGYAGHVALAIVSLLTQKSNLAELASIAKDERTWLTKLHHKLEDDAKPYDGAIAALMRDSKPSEINAFIAHSLRRKQVDEYDDFGESQFFVHFLDFWKEKHDIGQKMFFCMANYYVEVLELQKKDGKPMPTFADTLQNTAKLMPNYYFLSSYDREKVSAFMRKHNDLINWHLKYK